ncbi:phage tail protein [Paenibacillus lautus]|uniref:phage tail spike protein n=1 Tax=Paenibacillus lautus TaxID=1401 RepID=UPI00203E2656|nr:phage tail spike protein [Paenibacillus lautus]MCM3256983.1 phage tail protein [Paenibacillus lautus]
MLGDLDYNLKPIKPQFFICKPNREIIAKLSEAYNGKRTTKLNDVEELDLTIPFYIDVNHKLVRNKNIDLLRERYLIKVVTGNKVDWFIIKEITESAKDSETSKSIRCYSASHELTDKLIKSYSVESYHAEQVLNDILTNTIWSIDYLDADFKLTYRAFEFPSNTVLDAVFEVAETYNAIVHFDTDKRTISMTKPELTGLNRGLTFSYGKYLSSMDKTTQTDEMVTRLSAVGNDGLGIQKVNPTGQNYIENFGYFMYPFVRDVNRNVLSSSYHMSDSLCHALLDYEALVENKTGQFKSYLTQLKDYEEQLNQLNVDLNKLKNNEAVVTDTMLAQQFDGKMFFEKYNHSGSSSRDFTLNKTYAFAVMIKVDNNAGVTVILNGQSRPTTSNQWVLLGKVKDIDFTQVIVNGGNSGVFIQVANISLTEYNDSNNSAELVERYSLDNKQNQIRLKEIEIINKENQIKDVKTLISALQTTLLAENNFTPAQLQELNYFVIEREFNDDKYIDEQDLYEATEEKFKELQQPQLSIDVDIINFLEIVEEQRNWNKLTLGDFVNIKYEPTNTYVTARISEISYDYEASSIGLTLSNAKNVNDESTRIEKFLSNTKNTNITVDISKHKWGKAVVDTSEMSKLFENFWNKVTNDINMASNEFVTIDRKGITIIDPNDPLRFLRATHGVLGLTRSGGLRYETAISADGVIAEMVLGKIILGSRVVIGDDDGIFTIEGPKLTIQDRCEREVLKLGLLSERPDVFGMYVNRYASPDCSNRTITNVTGMNNDRGFYIDKIRNGITSNVFGLSQDGNLRLRTGDNNEVMIITSEGLGLGAENWINSPFRVNYRGEAWLESLWATNAYIQNSEFINGHIEGSSLTLRDGGGVMKMFPRIGLWAGHEEFDDAPFSVDMQGNLKAHKAKLIGKKGEILIDTDAGIIDMDKFDIINVGKLVAEMLEVNTILADKSYINNLTVNHLKTIGKDAEVGQYIDYIDIKDNFIKFITAKVATKEQAKDSRDRLLYWQDSEKRILTTEDTGIIAYAYGFNDNDIKVKQEITFEGSGDEAQPKRTIGLGDGTSNGGKAVEDKYNGGYKLSYGQSNTGRERGIDLRDTGISINSERGATMVTTKDFTVVAEDGTIKLGNSAGSSFELSPTGAKMDIKGSLDIAATGIVTINGQQIKLN